jgi:hypothetical protein
MGDNISMSKDNYPDIESSLDEPKSSGKILADFGDEEGRIVIYSDNIDGVDAIFLSINNVTIHLEEKDFLTVVKAVQKAAKEILDL